MPSAGDDLRSYFKDATVMEAAATHPALARVLRQLLRAVLPDELRSLLPDVEGSLGSVVQAQLIAGKPISLSAMRRRSNRALHAATAGEPARLPPQPHAYDDAEGYVTSYLAVMASPECVVPYSRVITLSRIHHPFPLLAWWAEHAPGCSVCSHHQVCHSAVRHACPTGASKP
jgi:hypothetical protein